MSKRNGRGLAMVRFTEDFDTLKKSGKKQKLISDLEAMSEENLCDLAPEHVVLTRSSRVVSRGKRAFIEADCGRVSQKSMRSVVQVAQAAVDDGENAYEKLRSANMKRNANMMRQLGIPEIVNIKKNKKSKVKSTEKDTSTVLEEDSSTVLEEDSSTVLEEDSSTVLEVACIDHASEPSMGVLLSVDEVDEESCWSCKEKLVSVTSLFCSICGMRQVGSMSGCVMETQDTDDDDDQDVQNNREKLTVQIVSTAAQNVSTAEQNVSTAVQNVSPAGQNVSTTVHNVSTSVQNVSTVVQNVSTAVQNVSTEVLGIADSMLFYERVFHPRPRRLPTENLWGKKFLKKFFPRQHEKLNLNHGDVRHWFSDMSDPFVQGFIDHPSIRHDSVFMKRLVDFVAQRELELASLVFVKEGLTLRWKMEDIVHYAIEIKHYKRKLK